MTQTKIQRLLRFAAVMAIVALVLMVWAIFDSRVVPVMIFMTLGQILGTLSLVIYLVVLFTDTRRRLAESGRTTQKATNIMTAPAPSADPHVILFVLFCLGYVF